MKTLIQIIEELDNNVFYLLDTWFRRKEDEQQQFIHLIAQCKKDKLVNEKNLENYIKGTFLEKELENFVNFLEGNIIKNNDENYLYSLKKIINTVISNKSHNNKYNKEEL